MILVDIDNYNPSVNRMSSWSILDLNPSWELNESLDPINCKITSFLYISFCFRTIISLFKGSIV